MKLFEIPIYALSKDALMKRYEKQKNKIINKLELERTQNRDMRKINHIIDLGTYPQRLWEYNHIVGYIIIGFDERDIYFQQYVPAKPIERYRWMNRKNKTFLMDNCLTGCHFYYHNCKTDEELRNRLHKMLEGVIQNVDKRFYVDMEAFEQADRLIDYSRLLGN